jgi:quinol monooxygenase YgiN
MSFFSKLFGTASAPSAPSDRQHASLPEHGWFWRGTLGSASVSTLAFAVRDADLPAAAKIEVSEHREQPGLAMIFVGDDDSAVVEAAAAGITALVARHAASDVQSGFLKLSISAKCAPIGPKCQLVIPQIRPADDARAEFVAILAQGMGMVGKHPGTEQIGLYEEVGGNLVYVYEIWVDYATVYGVRYGNPEMAAQADKTMASARGPHHVDWLNLLYAR